MVSTNTAYYANLFDFKVVLVDIMKIDQDTCTSKSHDAVQPLWAWLDQLSFVADNLYVYNSEPSWVNYFMLAIVATGDL